MEAGKVLVAVNGSKADAEAVQLACLLTKPNRGRVYVIYVIEVARTLPLDAEIEPETRRGEEVLSRAEQMAEEQDYEVETELLQAREAGPAVVDEALARGVDLIILALPHRKRFGEFDLGKTAPYILRNALCRVWVCREPSSV